MKLTTASIAGLAVAAWSLIMVELAIYGGVQHDYAAYVFQWKATLGGADPWTDIANNGNAYGPAQTVFAYLLPISDMAPKAIFVAALLLANALLVRSLLAKGATASDVVVYCLAIPTNFLIISYAVTFGLNDGFVAAMTTYAVLARANRKMVLAGCLLGVAILMKYYPLFLVPFFALEAGRIRFRLIVAAAAVTVLGLAATAAIWGPGYLETLRFAGDREPKFLSILAGFSAHPGLVPADALAFLLKYNSLLVLGVAATGFLIAWRTHINWLEGAALGLLAILLTYKFGQQQFFLPWLFLVAALGLTGLESSRTLAVICLPFVLFLSAFQWGYAYGSDHYLKELHFVRTDAGFVAFPLGLATIAAYFWVRRRDRRPPNRESGTVPA